MKIHSISISKYKNLSGIIKLDNSLVTLLIGQNGLGKSNLLEVLAKIFTYLYTRALGWRKFDNFDKPNFDFQIDYECNGNELRAGSKNGQLGFYILDKERQVYKPIIKHELIDSSQLYLPTQIFIYYSGENRRIERLEDDFVKEEHKRRRLNISHGGEVTEPRHILAIDNSHSLLILLTLLFYRQNPNYSIDINNVLEDVLNIRIKNVLGLTLHSPRFAKISELKKQEELLQNYYRRMIEGEISVENIRFWRINGKIETFLRYVFQYAQQVSSPVEMTVNKRLSKEYVNFSSINVTKDFCKGLYNLFPTPIEFFNLLYEMNKLDMIDNINFSISKSEASNETFSFGQLSEGEQQYLTVMGLITLNKIINTEALFLLDEPDTHINPLWQRSYIDNIEKTVGIESKDKVQFFISTHSPFLVQSYDKNVVSMLLFRHDYKGNIVIDNGNYSLKNWRIDQVMMSQYFEFPNARPISTDKFMEARDKIITKGILNDEDRKELENIIKAEGNLPTGETINDIEAMAYINSEVKKLKEKQ